MLNVDARSKLKYKLTYAQCWGTPNVKDCVMAVGPLDHPEVARETRLELAHVASDRLTAVGPLDYMEISCKQM